MVIKLLLGLQKFQKTHNKLIINEHDQKIPKERYICPKKYKKLLIIQD